MRPRRLTAETPEVIEKKLAEGRGQGHGKNYKPWIMVGEFRNRGESHIIPGIKIRGRSHHYFSVLEQRMHYLAEYLPSVVDFREQYPILPLQESLDIAARLGIKHPALHGHPKVITLDLLVTLQRPNKTVLAARSIKTSEELSDPRTREKQRLEKEICRLRGIPWTVATEKELTSTLEKSLKNLFRWTTDIDRVPPKHLVSAFMAAFVEEPLDAPIRHILRSVGAAIRVPYHYAVWLFRYLAWHQTIKVDIHSLIELPKPHLALKKNQASE